MSKIKNKQILVNSDFDFNGYKLINLGVPETDNDAIRLLDLTSVEDSLAQAIRNVDAGGILDNISSLETLITTNDSSLESVIIDEISNRESADDSLETAIGQIDSDLSGDITSLETLITDEISTEISNRESADDSLESAISQIDGDLSGDITSLETLITTNDSSLETLITDEISTEISNRESADDSLESAIGQIDSDLSGDITSLETLITTNDNSLETLITDEISTEVSNRESADDSLENAITTQITEHKHSELYNPSNLEGQPVVYIDNAGNLQIDGDIYQNGSTYETHAEQIYTTKDYIILRSGSTAGLANGEYAGFEAKNYDGVNDGRLVFDNTGTARVGDIGDEKPLVTRPESELITDGQVAMWDSGTTSLRFETIDVSGDIEDAAGLGLTYENEQLNVVVDDDTVKIVNNELRTTKFITEKDSTTIISSGDTGSATNLSLTYIPVGDITVTVNGIEYMVSDQSNTSITGSPFYFQTYPISTEGATLYYDATEAGFGLDTEDLIVVKYNYILLSSVQVV